MPFPAGMINTHLFPAQYFSGADLSLYWNDKYLLEVTSLEFQMVEAVQPIYGWNSYVYERVIRGARQITGAFQVPMVVPDMVRTVLRRIQNEQATPRAVSGQVRASERLLGGTPEDFARMEREAMERLAGRSATQTGSAKRPYFPHLNGLDLVIRFGVTQDPSVFSSVIDISEADAYRLTGIHIFGLHHVIPSDGGPVFEQYRFVARDLVPITAI